jgi:hypothetical protein
VTLMCPAGATRSERAPGVCRLATLRSVCARWRTVRSSALVLLALAVCGAEGLAESHTEDPGAFQVSERLQAAEVDAQLLGPGAGDGVGLAVPEGVTAVAEGIWIGKGDLDARPTDGASWSEVLAVAVSEWTVQSIEQQSSHVFHQQAMAGALVYARLAPHPSAEPFRAKVAQAIRHVMAAPFDPATSVTAPSRNLGAWAINADLIDLPAYDPALDVQFRAWLVAKLDQPYTSNPSTIRASVSRPNNIGAWSRFAMVACARYLDDPVSLDLMARTMRRWLGDTSVVDVDFLWYGDQSWHMTPAIDATKAGINPRGATRDGHNMDGIQPEDQNRGAPHAYDPLDFPNDVSNVRYIEVALAATAGTVLMLQRAGYTDLVDVSDSALLRAAQWIRYAAETFPSKGYRYFTDSREASRPLFTYLYPDADLPDTRERPQFAGREFGFAWTYWTHGR